MTASSHDLHPDFHHRALVHQGPDDLASRVGPELAAALERGEPVHLSLTAEQWTAMRDHVGPALDDAAHLPAQHRYSSPGRAMAELHDFVQRALDQGAAKAWSVGSVQMEGDSYRDVRWMRYESAVEPVLGNLPLTGICLYEADSPAATLDTVRRCHAVLDEPGRGLHPSVDHQPYDHGGVSWRHRDRPPVLDAVVTNAADLRRSLAHTLRDALAADRLEEAQLVATELVTNGMRHGADPITVRAWDHGVDVVIEVCDNGPGIDDPYADLRPCHGGRDGGWGMWLLGQISDQVSIGREAGRTIVLATLRRSAP